MYIVHAHVHVVFMLVWLRCYVPVGVVFFRGSFGKCITYEEKLHSECMTYVHVHNGEGGRGGVFEGGRISLASWHWIIYMYSTLVRYACVAFVLYHLYV